ncbi:hypothetical protein BT63DRAFT_428320 [Microthyrium microscopicum]|uniref:T6SS Phospholipase effector Tle1-like catalytic domain-containing protein n=1 Tax=Microthyrium microscopicum TaxID=703497 RepID=A0A6A6TZ42_9PEZI|nr:hypothetical protein BT63DRAFT_428320 [Microthyrium microscopicum]
MASAMVEVLSVPAKTTEVIVKCPPKRLVVCCDGTWMNSNEGTDTGSGLLDNILGLGGLTLQQPTNVTRICRSIKPTSTKRIGDLVQPISQITFYGSGIGTANALDKAQGGLTGEGEAGVAEHIREAYQFISANYSADSEDEIVLVGFSRGSFTVRSVAAFINDVGLLTQKGMTYFYPIFEDWENQQKMLKPGYKATFSSYPFEGPRPRMFPDPTEYRKKLVQLGYTRPNIKVKAVAVFDTVGSLGVPRIAFWHDVSAPQHSLDFAFVDTMMPPNVENGIHALALDEIRKPFSPTLWEKPAPGQTLTQVWFSGAHADVGGSYADTSGANISLAWMVEKLSAFVEFDLDMLAYQYKVPAPTVKRDWGCGILNNEFAGAYTVFDYHVRTPGAYTRYNHESGEPYVPAQPLVSTNEKLHSSVRIRCGLSGPMPRTGKTPDSGVYCCPAWCGKDKVKPWTVTGLPKTPVKASGLSLEEIHKLQANIQWTRAGTTQMMGEDLIGKAEWEILKSISPGVADKFFSFGPK